MLKKTDFSPGVIKYDDFKNVSINIDNYALKEDMLQIEYPYEYLLDAGWYSGIKQFIVYVIQNCNWEEPIVKKYCKDISELETALDECHNLILKLVEKIEGNVSENNITDKINKDLREKEIYCEIHLKLA